MSTYLLLLAQNKKKAPIPEPKNIKHKDTFADYFTFLTFLISSGCVTTGLT